MVTATQDTFLFPSLHIYINSCFTSLSNFFLFISTQYRDSSCNKTYVHLHCNILLANGFSLIKLRRNHDYEYEKEKQKTKWDEACVTLKYFNTPHKHWYFFAQLLLYHEHDNKRIYTYWYHWLAHFHRVFLTLLGNTVPV